MSYVTKYTTGVAASGILLPSMNTETKKPEGGFEAPPVESQPPAQPERPEVVIEQERTAEKPTETEKPTPQEQPAEQPAVAPPPQPTQQQPNIVVPKDALTQEIERILENDLEELYFSMNAEDQMKFKLEGENVSRTIRQMMQSGTVKLRKVLGLVLNWLKMIPGVNKFFVEKQAKIKAEQILNLRDS